MFLSMFCKGNLVRLDPFITVTLTLFNAAKRSERKKFISPI